MKIIVCTSSAGTHHARDIDSTATPMRALCGALVERDVAGREAVHCRTCRQMITLRRSDEARAETAFTGLQGAAQVQRRRDETRIAALTAIAEGHPRVSRIRGEARNTNRSTLDALVKAGLAVRRGGRDGKPPSYELTARGRAELEAVA